MKKLAVYFSFITFIMIIFVGCSTNNKNSMTGIVFMGCSANNKSSMSGIYLRTSNGSNIIIDDNNFPIIMGNETGKEDVFDDLKSGDKIEVTYDAIAESYPGQTKIYSCKLIESGSVNDIPKDILDRLKEMGWSFDLSN